MSNQNNIPAFVGTGWAFPPEFVMGSQTVKLSDGVDDIGQSLRILLSTLPGERAMRPEFGCDLTPLLFEPLTTTLRTVTEDKVKTAIYLHEPRIEPLRVTVSLANANEGQLIISVDYRIRSNNTRHNYVFDFYQTEGTETS